MATHAQSIDATLDTTNVVGSFSIVDWKPLPGLKWMQCNWHYSIYVAIIYLLVIFSVQRKMRSRPPYKLRHSLAAWNSALSIFSMFGSYFMLFEMLDVLLNKSFFKSVCWSSTDERAQYWMWLFAMSKIAELGDTIFIVLRKQKLIFLHWCHHVSALIYTWYAVSQNISLGRWFVTMNYTVHTLMYGYYALRALQYRIPRPIAMLITTLQIMQMVFGGYVCFYALQAKVAGEHCEIPLRTVSLGVLVYIAMLIMFAQFFVRAYLYPRARRSLAQAKPTTSVAETAEHKTNGQNGNGKHLSNGCDRRPELQPSNGHPHQLKKLQ